MIHVSKEAIGMPMSIRFTADEESRLEALATRTGRSKSFYVREAVQAHLAELEDAYGAGRSGA